MSEKFQSRNQSEHYQPRNVYIVRETTKEQEEKVKSEWWAEQEESSLGAMRNM